MRNLGDDAAHRGRVGALDRLVELGNAQAFDHIFLFFGITD
mgnify:CR=1 FL=1